MYSKNDYRYYLEHRLAESNNYLAHYGVKGMKWKKHLANKVDSYLANKARNLGYGGTYYVNNDASGKTYSNMTQVKKNNKDLAANYLYDRGYHANKAALKAVKKIKNKRVRKVANKAIKTLNKKYNKVIVDKARKRAYDSHNAVERDGSVVRKRGKKVR